MSMTLIKTIIMIRFGGYSVGVRKKTEPLGGMYVKKTEILGGVPKS